METDSLHPSIHQHCTLSETT